MLCYSVVSLLDFSLKASYFGFFLLFSKSQNLQEIVQNKLWVLINLSVINGWIFHKACLSYALCGQLSISASWQREGYQLSLLQGELTTVLRLLTAKLRRLTGVLCHEDYRVPRRHFRQGLVESSADGHVVSLFYSPFSSFLCFVLLRYCFFFPATRRPKWKWRSRLKRPIRPQKTPFGPLILLSSSANWFTYRVQLKWLKWLTVIFWFES